MKYIVFIAVVALVGFTMAAPQSKSKPTPSSNFQKKPCQQSCPFDYKPICGGEGKTKITFGNTCVMENYNCDKGTKLTKISNGECAGGAPVRLS